MSCGVGHRRDWDPVLLCLWYGPEATAPVRPLAWDPPYATSVALKRHTKKRPKKKKKLGMLLNILPKMEKYSHVKGQ